jgi:cell cycle arrest protein BUB3
MESSAALPEAIVVPDAPTDGITALAYLPHTSLLAATSWDGSVRVYDTSTTASPHLERSHFLHAGPCLSLATTDDKVYVGSLDGSIRSLALDAPEAVTVGRHVVAAAASSQQDTDRVGCSCLATLIPTENGDTTSNSSPPPLIVSAGWHRQLHIWDERQAEPVATVPLPGKAFAMDITQSRPAPYSHLAIVACSGRRTVVVDVTTPSQARIVIDRESSLKYQTRTIRCFADGQAIAVGSVEGRVAVEYLDDPALGGTGANQRNQYAFKCHRVGDLVYPVNCIAFHPRFGTFATGGCDGTVGRSWQHLFVYIVTESLEGLVYCFECWHDTKLKYLSRRCSLCFYFFIVTWDGWNKKKLATLPKFPTSIAALAFNDDGSQLAIASSYTFEDGEREHPRDDIYIRAMLDSECQPKQQQQQQQASSWREIMDNLLVLFAQIIHVFQICGEIERWLLGMLHFGLFCCTE